MLKSPEKLPSEVHATGMAGLRDTAASLGQCPLIQLFPWLQSQLIPIISFLQERKATFHLVVGERGLGLLLQLLFFLSPVGHSVLITCLSPDSITVLHLPDAVAVGEVQILLSSGLSSPPLSSGSCLPQPVSPPPLTHFAPQVCTLPATVSIRPNCGAGTVV